MSIRTLAQIVADSGALDALADDTAARLVLDELTEDERALYVPQFLLTGAVAAVEERRP